MKRIMTWLLVAAFCMMGVVMATASPVAAQAPDLTLDSTKCTDWSVLFEGGTAGKTTSWEATYYQSGPNRVRTVMRWDVSEMTEEADEAKLFVRFAAGNPGGNEIEFWRLLEDDWVGTQATWTNRKTGTAWCTAGGPYGYHMGNVTVTTSAGYYEIDITDHVNHAYNNSEDLLILMRLDTESGSSNLVYTAASPSNANTGWRPYIEINYPVIVTPTISESHPSRGYSYINFRFDLTDDGGEACEVKLYYGETNEGTNWTAWDKSIDHVGRYTTGQWVQFTASGLTPGTTYYYRYRATNSAGDGLSGVNSWATLAIVVVTISNAGFTDVSWDEANVYCSMDDWGGEIGSTTVYWGETDHGTNGTAWSHNYSAAFDFGGGPAYSVNWQRTLTGLSGNTTYYFRFSHTNTGGTSWTATDNFTTLRTPVGLGVEWLPGYYVQTITSGPWTYERYWIRARITGDDGVDLVQGSWYQTDPGILGSPGWGTVQRTYSYSSMWRQDDIIWIWAGHNREYYEMLGLDWEDFVDKRMRHNVYVGYGSGYSGVPPAIATTGWREVRYDTFLGRPGTDWERWTARVHGIADGFPGVWWLVLVGCLGGIYVGFRKNRTVMLALGGCVLAFFVIAGLIETWLVVLLALVAGAVVFMVLKRPFSGGAASE